ncbi:uncharacterized protein LOC114531850 [Dendronephthya gigantea]|uniref:uncharacterized protein LOC114531850 n=1 Tax=Dendronephthya gigantea TaxID=151771 RepID=UPI00106D061D|nr:uncharacterized protein LOC114531850 [Dendronephthya gigantea]
MADPPESKKSHKTLFKENKFQEALAIAANLLQVKEFYKDQETALRQFFQGKNIFFSAHTGYGKSLVFQAIPILADVMAENVIGTSVVVVISPLTSLMKDQVKTVNENFGISAATIYDGQDNQVLENIEDCVYSIVYTSPESFIASKRWRSLAS